MGPSVMETATLLLLAGLLGLKDGKTQNRNLTQGRASCTTMQGTGYKINCLEVNRAISIEQSLSGKTTKESHSPPKKGLGLQCLGEGRVLAGMGTKDRERAGSPLCSPTSPSPTHLFTSPTGPQPSSPNTGLNPAPRQLPLKKETWEVASWGKRGSRRGRHPIHQHPECVLSGTSWATGRIHQAGMLTLSGPTSHGAGPGVGG